ncbi:MAG TPA: hypothetical protein P5555_14960 [Candidatus Paceibacterota bacterium]|nr:hypothetical protein [Candidatus Paceibacterota bacterium]HRZ55658.1 hypothetical protein [Candidatus Paceibacterota bacterium]
MNANATKLTKKILMGLPDGLFLVSNLIRIWTDSIFAETIRPGLHRFAQWRRVVAVGAKGRLLCSEDKLHQCHRRLVVEYLHRRWSNLSISHIV